MLIFKEEVRILNMGKQFQRKTFEFAVTLRKTDGG